MTRHELKTWPQYFAAVRSGKKRFEIRRNDREFAVGDVLVLREFDPEQDEPSYEPAKPVWQRFARLIVPIGIVLYILISSIANRGG